MDHLPGTVDAGVEEPTVTGLGERGVDPAAEGFRIVAPGVLDLDARSGRRATPGSKEKHRCQGDYHPGKPLEGMNRWASDCV